MANEVTGHDGQGDCAATAGLTHRVLVFDVACDLRRLVVNGDRPMREARRGDSFIAEGQIYRGGTIPGGGTTTAPGPFDPDTSPGSIGSWVCRGVFHRAFAEILAEGAPHAFTTQVLRFNDGSGLVTEGPEGGPVIRALVGGMGTFACATGSTRARPLGTNVTGLFNLRLTFHLRTHLRRAGHRERRGGSQPSRIRREP
jgi:hypothetical protein